MTTRLLFVHAISPLHAGTGQGVGVIDLPVAREKATGLPYLPGSSLKGVLRDQCPEKDNLKKHMFGPEGENASDHAGSMQFSDQRLLLLPVRSLAGTFAWVTSPFVLNRLVRDLKHAGRQGFPSRVPTVAKLEDCVIAQDAQTLLVEKGIYLEDLDLAPKPDADAKKWAEWIGNQVFPDTEETGWRTMLTERLCIVHDDILSFLLETATEITARIKLDDDKKTVTKGALWYEEALPAETILSGVAVATPTKEIEKTIKAPELFIALQSLLNDPLQFGGKATVGRGLCRVHLS